MLQVAQVERYLAVHEQLRATLKGKLEALDQRYDELEKDGREPAFADLARAWGAVAKLLVSVKKEQVDALNTARFSLSEYDWVRLWPPSASSLVTTGENGSSWTHTRSRQAIACTS